jgi:hypothetical protein
VETNLAAPAALPFEHACHALARAVSCGVLGRTLIATDRTVKHEPVAMLV